MAIRKINEYWYVDVRFNGKRYRKKTPINSKNGAQAYELQIRSKLARGEPIVEHENDKEMGQLYRDFAPKWLDLYVKDRKKHSTVLTYRYILRVHLIPYFGRIPINRITTLKVERFKSDKIKAGLAHKSINNFLTVLSKSLRCAQEWYDLEKMPKIKWLKNRPPDFVFFSHDECDRLLECANGMWYEMIFTALKTGLRIGELMVLDWSDINWDTKVLTVRRSIYRNEIDTPKSNRNRHIPLTQELSDILYRRRQKKGYIFSEGENKILDENKPRRELRRIGKMAGLENIGWHVLRHTFASHLAMAGVSMRAIQELLGHQQITTTLQYAHLSPSTHREAISALERPNKGNSFGQYMGNEGKKPGDYVQIPVPDKTKILANI